MKYIAALIVILFLAGCSTRQEVKQPTINITSTSNTQQIQEKRGIDTKSISIPADEYVTEVYFSDFDIHNNNSMGSYDEVILMSPNGAWISWTSGDARAPKTGEWYKVERLGTGVKGSIFIRLFNNSGQESTVKIGAIKTNTGKIYQ